MGESRSPDGVAAAEDAEAPLDGEALDGILKALDLVLANAPDDAYDIALDSATAVLNTLGERVHTAHRRRILSS